MTEQTGPNDDDHQRLTADEADAVRECDDCVIRGQIVFLCPAHDGIRHDGPLDLDAIKARLDAASPGPWRWYGNTRYTMYLVRWGDCGWEIVMSQTRKGMHDAALQFNTDGRLVRADTLAVYEVCRDATSADDPRVYRHDIVDIRHPDADLIAHAPTDIAALIAEVERLRAEHWRLVRRVRDMCRVADGLMDKLGLQSVMVPRKGGTINYRRSA